MEEYRTHLYARLKHRKFDELTIKEIMRQLTVHCKDFVYKDSLPPDINGINAAEHFDSILKSYDFIEVYKKEDTRMFGTGCLFVYFMCDLDDEINHYGRFLWKSSMITDKMRLGLIINLRPRISISFKSLGKELSDTEVDSVLNQLDAWVNQGYLNKYYWTDFETFFGNPEKKFPKKKFPKKKFCCEIFELLSRLEMSPTYITPARFKEFCSLLFLFKLSKESGALDTAWNRACGKIY